MPVGVTTSARSRAVIITGGGTGIGRATAHAFAEEGANVLIVGRTASTLEETACRYPSIRWMAIDITEPCAPDRIVDTALCEFGRIDVLVNNAVTVSPEVLGEINRHLADQQLATNLFAPVFLTQSALASLGATRGVVINISTAGSVGRRGWRMLSVYGACKVAMDFLTRTWAVELAPRGVRVLCLAPGVVDTGIGERMGWSPEQNARHLAERAKRIPAGRLARAEEMAWWITRLARPEAEYATGAVVPVDGAGFI